MALKLPETVRIGWRDFKVILEEKGDGGEFSCSKEQITVSQAYPDGLPYTDSILLEVFLHEIIEAMLTDYDLRFTSTDDSTIFVLDHTELTHFARHLVPVVQKLMELNR